MNPFQRIFTEQTVVTTLLIFGIEILLSFSSLIFPNNVLFQYIKDFPFFRKHIFDIIRLILSRPRLPVTIRPALARWIVTIPICQIQKKLLYFSRNAIHLFL